MVKRYAKGYRLERALLHELHRHGWAVLRAPRSGRIGLPSPDIVAAKAGKIVVVECKACENGFRLPAEQERQLAEWEARAGAAAYVAWKASRKQVRFLKLADVSAADGKINRALAERAGIGIEQL